MMVIKYLIISISREFLLVSMILFMGVDCFSDSAELTAVTF